MEIEDEFARRTHPRFRLPVIADFGLMPTSPSLRRGIEHKGAASEYQHNSPAYDPVTILKDCRDQPTSRLTIHKICLIYPYFPAQAFNLC